MSALDTLDPRYAWLAFGLVLAIGEMVIPGVFLIWVAGAALITGLALWFVPLGMAAQVMVFAVLAILSVFVGRRWLAAHPVVPADAAMNDRGARLLGEVVTVTRAIADGTGRVQVADGEWLAKGPDAEPGTRMRVSGNQGTVLVVEHLH